jgi:hypothetical protein
MPPGSKQSRHLSSYLLESPGLPWHCQLASPSVRLVRAQRAKRQHPLNRLGAVILTVLSLFAQQALPNYPSSRLPQHLLLPRGWRARKGRCQGEREKLIQAHHGGNQTLMAARMHLPHYHFLDQKIGCLLCLSPRIVRN